MKDRPLEEKPACSIQSVPYPSEVTCSQCGNYLEIWSDEIESRCGDCGCAVRCENSEGTGEKA